MGSIRSVESLALALLRLIGEEARKDRTVKVIAQLPVEVATYLMNEKREWLNSIESKSDTQVVLVPNRYMETPQYEIRRVRDDEAGLPENSNISHLIPVAPATVIDDAKREEIAKTQAAAVVSSSVPSIPPPQSVALESAQTPPQPVEQIGIFVKLWRFFFGGIERKPEATVLPAPSERPRHEGRRDRNDSRRDRERHGSRSPRDRDRDRSKPSERNAQHQNRDRDAQRDRKRELGTEQATARSDDRRAQNAPRPVNAPSQQSQGPRPESTGAPAANPSEGQRSERSGRNRRGRRRRGGRGRGGEEGSAGNDAQSQPQSQGGHGHSSNGGPSHQNESSSRQEPHAEHQHAGGSPAHESSPRPQPSSQPERPAAREQSDFAPRESGHQNGGGSTQPSAPAPSETGKTHTVWSSSPPSTSSSWGPGSGSARRDE
jgi:ribonuclease E